MSWRTVVVSSRAKLDLRLDCLEVRGDNTVKIHLSEISMLIIESTAVSMTAALLCELIKQKIKVIFCDEQRNPCSELIAYYGCHDTSAKLKMQLGWSAHIKGEIWTLIVREKISRQKQLLARYRLPAAEKLECYLQQLVYMDKTNREGHAAKVYFNALFGQEFSRAEDCPINAALNYGYSILLSAVNREIAANGYLTQLGLFHDNMFNPFNLGSDLMEPFRPLVDKVVAELQPQELNHQRKMEIIDLLNATVIIDGREQYINNAIKIYCKSVFDALNENDVSLMRFYRNEL